MAKHQDIIQQQIDYYRARAGEYDEWFYRIGRYDRGEALNRQWFEEIAAVIGALRRLGRFGHVLELAGGTGIWTRELASLADRVTVIDAAPEMLAINREKVGSPKIDYVQADIFAWQPTGQFDLVFFGFWLSHVPPEKAEAFLSKVYRATRPGGRAFLVDSRHEQTSTARDHALPDQGETTLTRRLNNGQEFTIVKVFYPPEQVGQMLERVGFSADVTSTPAYFYYADASRTDALSGTR
jgi:demethylmenaquinone methyltransferase/2-methoxy-6-polyprenyl-1,4-benzoquinol methylase